MCRSMSRIKSLVATAAMALSGAAMAAGPHEAALGAAWALPFAGLLLSIALWPLLAAGFWHRHFGKIALAWTLAFLVPYVATFGAGAALGELSHAVVAEYLPFIVLLGALYTSAGGICVHGTWRPSAASNTGLLALGAVLASVVGTTGAAMLLIRPLLRANAHRRHAVHVVVFFIFLVANIGGALTPLGDPPLFLGFLNGVDFFWTTRHLLAPTAFVTGALLVLFYAMDRFLWTREAPEAARVAVSGAARSMRIDGRINFGLLILMLAMVVGSGVWRPGIDVNVLGTPVALQNLVRDALLAGLAGLSLLLTPTSARAGNDFNWGPIKEVAKLFAGIFITIAPVIAMLRAGEHGPLAALIRMAGDAHGAPIVWRYFWATGLLSSLLDNAPTYLVFFNMAGGHAQTLMTTSAATLAAISAGAVYMGANTYIGNAPNFMVKAIAESRGVPMPGFFGYLVWSGCILLPLYAITGWLFFS